MRAYAEANPQFPHDSTINQWFTESQFESYRALGEHAIEMIARQRDTSWTVLDPQPATAKLVDLIDFCTRAEAYVKGFAARTAS